MVMRWHDRSPDCPIWLDHAPVTRERQGKYHVELTGGFTFCSTLGVSRKPCYACFADFSAFCAQPFRSHSVPKQARFRMPDSHAKPRGHNVVVVVSEIHALTRKMVRPHRRVIRTLRMVSILARYCCRCSGVNRCQVPIAAATEIVTTART
jgi:hypothetical protein